VANAPVAEIISESFANAKLKKEPSVPEKASKNSVESKQRSEPPDTPKPEKNKSAALVSKPPAERKPGLDEIVKSSHQFEAPPKSAAPKELEALLTEKVEEKFIFGVKREFFYAFLIIIVCIVVGYFLGNSEFTH
jgi:hypothetical protein